MRDATEREMEFAAYIGIDWAEQKHACALQSSTMSGVEESELLTQTGSGGSLGKRTVSTIRWTPDCHRTRAIAWIASVHASQV